MTRPLERENHDVRITQARQIALTQQTATTPEAIGHALAAFKFNVPMKEQSVGMRSRVLSWLLISRVGKSEPGQLRSSSVDLLSRFHSNSRFGCLLMVVFGGSCVILLLITVLLVVVLLVLILLLVILPSVRSLLIVRFLVLMIMSRERLIRFKRSISANRQARYFCKEEDIYIYKAADASLSEERPSS